MFETNPTSMGWLQTSDMCMCRIRNLFHWLISWYLFAIHWKNQVHSLTQTEFLKENIQKSDQSHPIWQYFFQFFCFLLFYISSYINRHHISQLLLRTSFNIIWKKTTKKKIFTNHKFTNFPILMESLKPPQPLTAKIH